jgi:hypothetical protein
MQSIIQLASERGAAWIYVTDDGADGNPYDDVPSYWTTEGNTVLQQGVQAPYAIFWPKSTLSGGRISPAQVAFRWRAVNTNGVDWQIFLDTDQNASTGYHGGGIAVGADYLLQASNDGSATLFQYAGMGTNWSWTPITTADATISFPDPGIDLVQFNLGNLGKTSALNYQIRALNGLGATLYTSYVVPLSLTNTGLVFDILNHDQ